MNDELTAYDLRFNIWALLGCLYKRGHPNVDYEENEKLFEENYSKFENEYYFPEETLNDLGLLDN